MELGHTFLKTMREKTDRAMMFLEESEGEQLKEEVDTQLSQLESLIRALRTELSTTEKSIQLSKDFLDKYKAQSQWLTETKSLLASPVEPKAELYQKKAQLAKYKVSKHRSLMTLLHSLKPVSESQCISGLHCKPSLTLLNILVFFKTIQQSIQSHESAVRSVIERGEALLETIRDPSINENICKLKADYQDLCNDAKVLSSFI